MRGPMPGSCLPAFPTSPSSTPRISTRVSSASGMCWGSQALKGQCHDIFDFRFFHESVSPKSLSIPLGPF
jgi:hypothetical protein